MKKIVENEPGRVETLRRLTGGVTRTIVLLYEIFVDDETGSAFKDLESILDRVTPLCKYRMDDLSPQLQKIVHAIALNWDAMPTKEIAKKTRIPSSSVAAQLKKLAKNGVILEIKPPHTKNKLYIIRERFFNIWYLMRNGREGDKNKVIWLVRFFESWLKPKELRVRIEKFLYGIEQDVYEDGQKADLMLLYQHPVLRTPRYLIQEILLKEGRHPIAEVDFLKENEDVFKCKLKNPNFEFSQKEFQDLLFLSNISLATKSKIIKNFATISETAYQKIYAALLKEEKYLCEKAISLLGNEEDCDGNYIALANLQQHYLGGKGRALYYYSKAAAIGCCDNFKLGELYYNNGYLYNVFHIHTYATVLLWNNKFEEAKKISHLFFDDPNSYKEFSDDIVDYVLLLIAKERFEDARELFIGELNKKYKLQDRFKPVYYALMHYLKKEHPLEHLKMGTELKETVQEIIAKIEEKRNNVLTHKS